jgi:acyl carrier protein
MLERISKVVNDYKEIDFEITENTSFEELGLDSLDTVELIMNIEEEFGVNIEIDESIKSVKDLMTILENA